MLSGTVLIGQNYLIGRHVTVMGHFGGKSAHQIYLDATGAETVLAKRVAVEQSRAKSSRSQPNLQ
jgi:hypothetical protein